MAVVIVRDAINGRTLSTSQPGRRMYLYAESVGAVLALPFAPQQISYEGWTQEWTETERTGNKPLLLRKGGQLASIKFSTVLASSDPFRSQTGLLATLRQLCATRERLLVRYGPSEAGLWRLTECSVSSEQRHPDSNEVTHAVASLTLTEASDAAPAVGPVHPPPAPPPPPSAPPPPPRTHRVVKDDCLWKIALRYYGRGTLWPRLYDANRHLIRNPHLIFPNQVFVIP